MKKFPWEIQGHLKNHIVIDLTWQELMIFWKCNWTEDTDYLQEKNNLLEVTFASLDFTLTVNAKGFAQNIH